jgi:hypothetical protein
MRTECSIVVEAKSLDDPNIVLRKEKDRLRPVTFAHVVPGRFHLPIMFSSSCIHLARCESGSTRIAHGKEDRAMPIAPPLVTLRVMEMLKLVVPGGTAFHVELVANSV